MKILCSIMLCAFLLIGLAGCISKPYVMTMDRVDQKMNIGNRGYLKGAPPPVGDRGDLKRPFIAVDIDLPPTGIEGETTEAQPYIERTEEPARITQSAPVKEKANREEDIK